MAFKKNFISDTGKLIWKIIHDQNARFLVLETRDSTTTETSFSLFDMSLKKEVFDGLYFEETWWISVAAVCEDIIVFLNYEDDRDPSSKSSFAYDYHKNEILWQRDNLSISEINKGIGLGAIQDHDEIKKVNVDIKTGGTLPLEKYPLGGSRKPNYPIIYHQESASHDLIKDFIASEHIVTTGDIQYLEYKDYVFISFYTINENSKWTNIFWVLNESGQILHRDVLGKDLVGIAQDSFYILADYLIYIKKKTEICIYEL